MLEFLTFLALFVYLKFSLLHGQYTVMCVNEIYICDNTGDLLSAPDPYVVVNAIISGSSRTLGQTSAGTNVNTITYSNQCWNVSGINNYFNFDIYDDGILAYFRCEVSFYGNATGSFRKYCTASGASCSDHVDVSFSLTTPKPTVAPTHSPTKNPTLNPALSTTFNPTQKPTVAPTFSPTLHPVSSSIPNPTSYSAPNSTSSSIPNSTSYSTNKPSSQSTIILNSTTTDASLSALQSSEKVKTNNVTLIGIIIGLTVLIVILIIGFTCFKRITKINKIRMHAEGAQEKGGIEGDTEGDMSVPPKHDDKSAILPGEMTQGSIINVTSTPDGDEDSNRTIQAKIHLPPLPNEPENLQNEGSVSQQSEDLFGTRPNSIEGNGTTLG